MTMKLVPINVPSIYKGKDGKLAPLPARMAQLTPDAAASLIAVQTEIEGRGGCFRLSDAYRSTEMQTRAHQDYKAGRKKAYSPPAGGSLHEAARAIDLDLAALIHPPSVPRGYKVFSESQVREIFVRHGWTFISAIGNEHLVDVSESWHIEFRGRFQEVYDRELARTKSSKTAYKAMAKAAIADLTQ